MVTAGNALEKKKLNVTLRNHTFPTHGTAKKAYGRFWPPMPSAASSVE
jgi:hypothetical protein